MKKFNLLMLIFTASFAFFSCSSNEEPEISNDLNEKLLKKFSVKRDASGAYSLDFELSEKAKVDKVLDVTSNFNQFFLYRADNNTKTNIEESLVIDGSQLKVGFIDTNNMDAKTNITVIDDNIKLAAKGAAEQSKLKAYNITKNEEGIYELVFEVKNNVAVNFVYNESDEAYEIHLQSDVATETNFTRTLEQIPGKPLKIVFVNYVNNAKAKSATLEPIRKPIIIIEEEEENL